MSYLSLLSAATLATLLFGVPGEAFGQRRDSNRRFEQRVNDDRDSDDDSDSDDGDSDDGDSDDDSDRQGSNQNRRTSRVGQSCIDLNGDGLCDVATGENRRDRDSRVESRRSGNGNGVILGRRGRVPSATEAVILGRRTAGGRVSRGDPRIQLNRVLQRLGFFNLGS